MTIVRSETVTLPNTPDGRFMAEQYKEDMENVQMSVSVKTTTTTIEVCGIFAGDIPDDYVKKLKEAEDKHE